MQKYITTELNPNLLPPTLGAEQHKILVPTLAELRTTPMPGLRSLIHNQTYADLVGLHLGRVVNRVDPGFQDPLLQPGDTVLIATIDTKILRSPALLGVVTSVSCIILEVGGRQTYQHVLSLLKNANSEKPLMANMAARDAREVWVSADRINLMKLITQYIQKDPAHAFDLYPCLVEEMPEAVYVHSIMDEQNPFDPADRPFKPDWMHDLDDEVLRKTRTRRFEIPDRLMFVDPQIQTSHKE